MAEKPKDSYVVTTPVTDSRQAVLIVTADDVQDLEFFYPYYRFTEAGFQVDVATPKGGEFKGKMGMGLKETKAISDIDPARYQLLYIPGGKAPEALKKDKSAVALVTNFAQSGKPIAAICHGPQLLAEAGVINGKRIAGWPEIEREVQDVGGIFTNEATVTDGQFITARWPGDLPSHLARTLEALRGGQASRSAA